MNARGVVCEPQHALRLVPLDRALYVYVSRDQGRIGRGLFEKDLNTRKVL
jgi:hypothetical protein